MRDGRDDEEPEGTADDDWLIRASVVVVVVVAGEPSAAAATVDESADVAAVALSGVVYIAPTSATPAIAEAAPVSIRDRFAGCRRLFGGLGVV
ncbi:MAG: hypothetical protein WBV06_06475 [Acidimicrobiia bacterium]